MSASEFIDKQTLIDQLKQYRTTAFATEDGSRPSVLNEFNWAGGYSSYSFGLYQFDVRNNDLAEDALRSMGFTDTQIDQLSQRGTLGNDVKTALSEQLQAALATTAGKQIMDNLLNNYEAQLVHTTTNLLDITNDDIYSQIASEPESIQRIYDIANQFGTSLLRQFGGFLSGQSIVTNGISLTWSDSLTASENMENWFSAADPGDATRSDAFNNTVSKESLPETIINITKGDEDDATIAAFSELKNVQTRAEGMPTLSLIGKASRDNQKVSAGIGQPYLDSSHNDRYIGIQVSVPLFEGFTREYKIQEGLAQAEQKQGAVSEVRHNVELDVWKSFQSLKANTNNLPLIESLFDNTRKSYSVAEYRYENGVGNIIELLNAQKSLADAEKQQIQALTDWRYSRLELAGKLGVLGLNN